MQILDFLTFIYLEILQQEMKFQKNAIAIHFSYAKLYNIIIINIH